MKNQSAVMTESWLAECHGGGVLDGSSSKVGNTAASPSFGLTSKGIRLHGILKRAVVCGNGAAVGCWAGLRHGGTAAVIGSGSETGGSAERIAGQSVETRGAIAAL